MSPVRRRLVVMVPLLLIAAAALAARPDAPPPGREAEMRAIAATLACPVCQGLSVADSPSQLATQMRATILDKLAAGETREQIVQFFVDRYGEAILFEPPKRGFGLLVWWVPVLALLAGAVVLAMGLSAWLRRSRTAAPAPLAPDELASYRARLEAELARREEAL